MVPKQPCKVAWGKEFNSLTTESQTTKFSSANFQKISNPSYTILRIQRLEDKQCRSWWGGSWWATSSRSTLFANSAIFVTGSQRVKEPLLNFPPSVLPLWSIVRSFGFFTSGVSVSLPQEFVTLLLWQMFRNACVLFFVSAIKVHDSQAYRNMDVTAARISFIFGTRDIFLSRQIILCGTERNGTTSAAHYGEWI